MITGLGAERGFLAAVWPLLASSGVGFLGGEQSLPTRYREYRQVQKRIKACHDMTKALR